MLLNNAEQSKSDNSNNATVQQQEEATPEELDIEESIFDDDNIPF